MFLQRQRERMQEEIRLVQFRSRIIIWDCLGYAKNEGLSLLNNIYEQFMVL